MIERNLSTNIKVLNIDNNSKDKRIEKQNYQLVLATEKIQAMESTINVLKQELSNYINQEIHFKDKIKKLKNDNKEVNLKLNSYMSNFTNVSIHMNES